MDKILICGPRGVGKSTLIRRLTALYPGPVSGFVTKRETVADGEGLFPIYIHPAACPEARRQYGPENLIGRCDSRRSVRCTPAFDDWGPRLLDHPGEPGGAVPPAEAGPCTGRIITKNSGGLCLPLFFILLLLCQSMMRVKLMPLFCICTSSRTRSPRI